MKRISKKHAVMPYEDAIRHALEAGTESGNEVGIDQAFYKPRYETPVHQKPTEFSKNDIEAFVDRQIQRATESGSMVLKKDQSEEKIRRAVVATLTGLGPLQPLMDDPAVEEIWLNAPTSIFVARNGRSEQVPIELSDSQVRDLVERMLNTTGRRVDMSSPFVDASLPDGSRLHVTIPDITSAHWAINIRKFSRTVRTLAELTQLGSLSHHGAEFLRMCVLAKLNILVSGATQAGKTTILNALLAAARKTERIVTVEETFELNFDARDVVAMQCRQPNLEGGGEVTLRRLIKEALRMRPDRLVVGEVREAECLDLLIALNSGLPGACSVHANNADDALMKLCTLPLLAGRNIDSHFVSPAVASSIDVVVHCELNRHGERRVVEIACPTGRIVDSKVETVSIFTIQNGILMATGTLPIKREKFSSAHLNPEALLQLQLAS